MSDLVETFSAITGTDLVTSASYLETYGNDLDAGISFFFAEDVEVTQPRFADVSSVTEVDEETDIKRAIKQIFPNGDFPESWSLDGLVFNAQTSEPWSGFGMNQSKNGPCGVLAAFQALVMAQCTESGTFSPFYDIRQEDIAATIASILLTCAAASDSQLVILCSFDENIVGKSISSHSISTVDHVEFSRKVREHLHQYMAPGGIILLIVSAVLTRGIDAVKRDIQSSGGDGALVFGPFDLCTSALINLILTGIADDNVSSYGLDGRKRTFTAHSRVGLLSAMEQEMKILVHDSLKFPTHEIYILHGRDHFTTCFKVPAEGPSQHLQGGDSSSITGDGDTASSTFQLMHWNGLPPGGPRWTELTVTARGGCVGPAPLTAEEGLGVEYKPIVDTVDSIVQAYPADKQARPHGWKTWRYEVALVIDDLSNTSPELPEDRKRPPTFALTLPIHTHSSPSSSSSSSTSPSDNITAAAKADGGSVQVIETPVDMIPFLRTRWRCRACYETRFRTMCFGMNEGAGSGADAGPTDGGGLDDDPAGGSRDSIEEEMMLSQLCVHCSKPRREVGWTLWMSYAELPAGWQAAADAQFGPKIVNVLQTKWPRCIVDFNESLPPPSV